jgi:hypothetical protein
MDLANLQDDTPLPLKVGNQLRSDEELHPRRRDIASTLLGGGGSHTPAWYSQNLSNTLSLKNIKSKSPIADIDRKLRVYFLYSL